MHTTRILTSVFAVALVFALAGCSGVRKPYRVTQDPYGPGQVQVADKLPVVYDQPVVSYDESDLMVVSLPIRAATGRPQIIQYRTHFYDRSGQELYVTDWRTETLESNVHQTLKSRATSPRAERFKIDVRQAR